MNGLESPGFSRGEDVNGHLFPFCALLRELAARGHEIHVRTMASGVDLCLGEGFKAAPVDPRIEMLQSQETTRGVLRSARQTVRVLTERAVHEVDDFTDAVAEVDPDVIVVDANCWGAMSAAEAQPRPWLGLAEVHSADELLRRAPRMLVATGKPFEYPRTDWGDRVPDRARDLRSAGAAAGLARRHRRSRRAGHDVVGGSGRPGPGGRRDGRVRR